MIKQILIITTVLLVLSASNVLADINVAESSATVRKDLIVDSTDYRVLVLKKYLIEKNSPLVDYSKEFVQAADKYGLDWRLVPAITGVESTFGKFIPNNSYNAYGWANGSYSFESWEESINHVSKILKLKYIDRGAITINQISRIYAPPSTTWAYKVNGIMKKIDPLSVEFSLD